MKDILLITTGGTIASQNTSDGLSPSIDADSLVSFIPRHIADCCNLSAVSVMNIDSTNMSPSLMSKIADTVSANYDKYDGFVITHGTDTMAYTASALSCMLCSLSKPVILTGSQMPVEAAGTDAVNNLSDAIRFANEGFSGVFVSFYGKLISGICASKIRTLGFDAFESVNFPVAAWAEKNSIRVNKEWQDLISDKRSIYDKADFYADTKMCQDIIILKVFPGMNERLLELAVTFAKGIVIESFGIGGIPGSTADISTDISTDITRRLHILADSGIPVVITTQCLYDGVNLDVYEVGTTLARDNIINGNTLTTEAASMKLMWALAHFKNISEIKKYVESPLT